MSERERQWLDALLDLLIPANPDRGIPSAGAFGVAEFVRRSSTEDAVLAASLQALLERAEAAPKALDAEAVRELEHACPTHFERLLRAVYMGYYSRPEIRACLGLAARPVHPQGYDVVAESAELMESLTSAVRLRGAIYRPAGTPTGTS